MSSNTLLKEIYYDVSNPSSFGSVDKLYREAKSRDDKIKRKDVEDFLSAQLAYTLHRRLIRRFERNQIVANHYQELAQADLVDVTRYAKSNNGYHFILTMIDVFTRKAFAIPIKRKTAEDVAEAMRKIFASYRPLNLQTDEGKEFTNTIVQQLLKDMLINFYLATNENIKCAIIERYQRSLLSKMHKYFTANGTQKFMDILPALITSYNNTYHTSIKMTPSQASKTDPEIVFRNLYGFSNERDLLKNQMRKSNKHAEGTHVRIPVQKRAFRKGYKQNFTDQIYTVVSSGLSQKRPTYKLKDYDGGLVRGRFYPEEVQKVERNDIYRVSLLSSRKRGKRREFRVRFHNFPDHPPEWIPESDLISIS